MIQASPEESVLGSGNGKKVLIVEDDEAMSVALRDGFGFEGFEVLCARDGAAGLKMATEDAPDVVVLDVMLPKVSGLDVCKQLRAGGCDIPIIMLTARGQEIDKILGLKLGADDYMTKPFSMMELIVRVETILRRVGGGGERGETGLSRYQFGEVSIDFRKHEASKAGRAIELSPREFLLLEFFIQHRGEIVSRDQLLDSVWGFEHIPYTRTVDTHIAKLRKKIEDTPSAPRYLVTVHRLGYKFTG